MSHLSIIPFGADPAPNQPSGGSLVDSHRQLFRPVLTEARAFNDSAEATQLGELRDSGQPSPKRADLCS
jgi:hypothetical protein